jgi:hypothetical protein
MEDIDLPTMIELARLKNNKPEEYETMLSSIKEVIKDIAKLELEIVEELETEIKEKKRKEEDEKRRRRDDLDMAEKMKRDKPRSMM